LPVIIRNAFTELYGSTMATDLDADAKTFIVQCLACFDRPSKVVKAVKDEFGVVVTRQAVHWYDAERKGAEEIPEQWRQMFAAARKRFLEETADIGIANRAVRLRLLDRIATRGEEMGNHVIVLSACEAAAKEMGGFYTNRRHHELTGKDGKDLPTAAAVTIVLPDNGRGDFDFSRYSIEQLTKMYQDVAANRAHLVIGVAAASAEEQEPPPAAPE
jgi:hypothetical protein